MDNGKSAKTEKSGLKRGAKIIFWLLLLVLCTLGIAIFSINNYLQGSERKIIEHAAFLNQGTLSFDRAYVSLVKDFPHISLVLENVQLVDSMFAQHQHAILDHSEIYARISAKNWRTKTFEIEEFVLKNGAFTLFRDKQAYSNLKSIFRKKTSEKTPLHPLGLSINTEHFKLQIENFSVHIIDSIKTMDLSGTVKELSTEITNTSQELSAQTSMLIDVSQLIFNKKSGIFLENAQVSGKFKARLADEFVRIEPFPILVNQEQFDFSGSISTTRSQPTVLFLENKNTRLPQILPLLPAHISRKIRPFEVFGAFYSKTHIRLLPGTIPRVSVDFRLPKNDIAIRGIPFQKTRLSGRFINRKTFKDTEKGAAKDIRLELNTVHTEHEGFRLESEHILIWATKKTKPRIAGMMYVEGISSALSTWYKSDKFFFEKGNFTLKASVSGPLNDVPQLILDSRADLKIWDAALYYKPADVSIPMASMDLFKDFGDATFTISSSTLQKNYTYQLEGAINNFPAILADLEAETAQSLVSIEAKRLSWEDFVWLFGKKKGEETVTKDEKETKNSMKNTIQAIYRKFQPTINIQIDTFEYFEKIQLYHLQSGVHFESEHLLVLDSTHFDLDQGEIDLSARLDISHPHQTEFQIEMQAKSINLDKILPVFDYFKVKLLSDQKDFPDDFFVEISFTGIVDDVEGLLPNSSKGRINFRHKNDDFLSGTIHFEPTEDSTKQEMLTDIHLQGNPRLFNNFFATDNFIFQDSGRFQTHILYTGDVASMNQLLDKSDIEFSIFRGAVYYNGVDIIFPIENLHFTLERDTVAYELFMKSDILDRELQVEGAVHNLSELLYGNTGKPLSTTVNVESPILNLVHAIAIFETPPDPTAPVEESIDSKMKTLTTSLLNRFNPHIHANLDTFSLHEAVRFDNFTSGVHLKDSTIFILEQTNFDFCDGKIGLNVEMDLGKEDYEPFKTSISSTQLSLHQLLKKLDYLAIPSLQNATYLDGEISLFIDFQGSLQDLNIREDETQARVDFNIINLQVKGIDIIDNIAKKLHLSRYFEHIRFATIENTITIDGTHIDIPLMEIQSTSGNFFLEGYIDKNKETNLWLSIPLENIKKLKGFHIPEKQGYANTKGKIYLEIYTGKDSEVQTKFHFRKRKFYKQRGILKQYRADKRANRAIRKKKR